LSKEDYIEAIIKLSPHKIYLRMSVQKKGLGCCGYFPIKRYIFCILKVTSSK